MCTGVQLSMYEIKKAYQAVTHSGKKKDSTARSCLQENILIHDYKTFAIAKEEKAINMIKK